MKVFIMREEDPTADNFLEVKEAQISFENIEPFRVHTAVEHGVPVEHVWMEGENPPDKFVSIVLFEANKNE